MSENTPVSTRDCHIGLIIGSSTTEVNLVDEYGFHLLESPNFTVAPIRDYDIQEYPDSAEAEMDTRTTLKPFEYKLSLGYFGDEITANSAIQTFINSLFSTEQDSDSTEVSDIMTALPLQVKNYWKGMKMTGYAKKWDGKTYSIQGEAALVAFDLTIYVNDPRTFLPI